MAQDGNTPSNGAGGSQVDSSTESSQDGSTSQGFFHWSGFNAVGAIAGALSVVVGVIALLPDKPGVLPPAPPSSTSPSSSPPSSSPPSPSKSCLVGRWRLTQFTTTLKDGGNTLDLALAGTGPTKTFNANGIGVWDTSPSGLRLKIVRTSLGELDGNLEVRTFGRADFNYEVSGNQLRVGQYTWHNSSGAFYKNGQLDRPATIQPEAGVGTSDFLCAGSSLDISDDEGAQHFERIG